MEMCDDQSRRQCTEMSNDIKPTTIFCVHCRQESAPGITRRKGQVSVSRSCCESCQRAQRALGQARYRSTRAGLLKKDFYAERRDALRAHAAVWRAVKRGKLSKPESCENCKKPVPRAKLHGHHYKGYDHPLDVQWLCALCHVKIDRKG